MCSIQAHGRTVGQEQVSDYCGSGSRIEDCADREFDGRWGTEVSKSRGECVHSKCFAERVCVALPGLLHTVGMLDPLKPLV